MHRNTENSNSATEPKPYREKLRKTINDPEFGVLINADEWWRDRHPGTRKVKAAFQLGSSERFQKEFITLWELFDHRKDFDECVERLAELIAVIRRETPFTSIVSCTATSRHILERLHARIESPKEKIRIEYLHRYPFLARDQQSVLNFQGRKVIIFSDVVASGSLVNDLAAVVQDLGGEVVSVLCVVVSGKILINQIVENQNAEHDKPPKIKLIRTAMHVVEPKIPPLSADGTPLSGEEEEKESFVPLYNLTDRLIEDLGTKDYDESQVIPIDLDSVYPEDLPQGMNGKVPCFNSTETYEHLEHSGAILFDFFEVEGNHFTTGVRIERLLDKDRFGNVIWEALEPRLGELTKVLRRLDLAQEEQRHSLQEDLRNKFVLVTSFRAGDADFNDFVEKRIRASTVEAQTNQPKEKNEAQPKEKDEALVPTVYVNIRDLPEGTDYFLLPHDRRDLLVGRHVFLILASVSASQTLQDLVALLAANEVESITVVCLINRMGLRTQNFIARIRKLVRGISVRPSTKSNEHSEEDSTFDEANAAFDFIPVYGITELSNRDVRSLQNAVRTLFDTYVTRTLVPGFRNWIDQTRRHFESKILTDWEFQNTELRALSKPTTVAVHDPHLKRETVQLKSLDGVLSLLCHKVVTEKDFEGLIDLLTTLTRRRDLYQVFALLLYGVGYLRRRNRFGDLRSAILLRIRKLRKERWNLEQVGQKSPIELFETLDATIELESHLIFGLALFSYLDLQHFDYDEIVAEALTAGRSVDEWLETPLNFLQHFSDERLAWSISMLMLLSRQKFGEESSWVKLRGRLVIAIRSVQAVIRNNQETLEVRLTAFKNAEESDDNQSAATRSIATLCRLSKDNLDALLTDLGEHHFTRHDHVVRFLNIHLFAKRHHSPIQTALERLKLALETELDEKPRNPGDNSENWVSITSSSTKKVLDEASSTIGRLEEIGLAAVELFNFTPAERNQVVRYADPRDESSFIHDVQRFGQLIRSIRNSNSASYSEIQTISTTIGRIEDDLFGKFSELRKHLERYNVNIIDAMLEAMEYASKRFSSTTRKKNHRVSRGKIYRKIFDHEIAKLKQFREQTQAASAANNDQKFKNGQPSKPGKKPKEQKSKDGIKPIQQTKSPHFMPPVLVDPFLLREALRNVFTNVRHTVKGLNKSPDEYQSLLHVSWRDVSREENGVLTDYLLICVCCEGIAFEPKVIDELKSTRSTFQEHRLALAQYGATLSIHPLAQKKGAQVMIELIRRVNNS
jgi:hypothetical protein